MALILCSLGMILGQENVGKADMGPKPSVVVEFSGLDDVTYYVSLLSDTASTGPYTAYDVIENNKREPTDGVEEEVYQKFIEYEDSDGFYFLQYVQKCENNESFTWGYYPPQNFKIILYFADSDTFLVSNDIYERYAFDSYYSAQVSLEQKSMTATQMEVEEEYDFWSELGFLLVRILFTISVELIVALFFHYISKHNFTLIVVTNLLTQTLLNISLNLINYKVGYATYVLFYLLLELLVIIIEAVVYQKFVINTRQGKMRWTKTPICYAILANLISFAVGIWLSTSQVTQLFF